MITGDAEAGKSQLKMSGIDPGREMVRFFSPSQIGLDQVSSFVSVLLGGRRDVEEDESVFGVNQVVVEWKSDTHTQEEEPSTHSSAFHRNIERGPPSPPPSRLSVYQLFIPKVM